VNFFKLYIGDYQRDTAHLSITEHGAYQLMLQHYYATEKPLPTGKALYRMLRADSPADREAIDSIASQFWTTTTNGLVNDRALEEIEKSDHQRTVNREIGKLGGRPKKTDLVSKPQTHHITDSVSKSVSGSVSGSVSEMKPRNNPIQTPDSRLQTPDSKPTHSDAREEVPRETENANFHYRWVQDEIRRYYPTKIYKDQDWLAAEKQLLAIIENNLATRVELETWARDFAKQQQALGREGSQFVPNPARFYDHKQAAWRGPFPLPVDPKSAAKQAAEAATLTRITTHAKNIGCPLVRDDHDSPEIFEAKVQDWERKHWKPAPDDPRYQPKFASVAALAKSKTVGAA
jgi:uncharacterized protein YdaU (DUF1376 family)